MNRDVDESLTRNVQRVGAAVDVIDAMVIVHLVARLRGSRRDLGRFENAAWLWEHLDAQFPRTLARMIMPNHPHVLAAVEDPNEATNRLARICGHLQRRLGVPDLFEPVPRAEIVTPDKVSRTARYIELNACRSGLVLHPAEWLWTSLRDVLGASEVSIDRTLHGRLVRRQPDQWLQYVTRDERVLDRRAFSERVLGSRLIPAFGIESVVGAVAAVARQHPRNIRRRGSVRDLFLAAAGDQGITNTRLLARVCGCSMRSVQAARHRPPPSGLTAVRQCLADPRLLRPVVQLARELVRPMEVLADESGATQAR